MYGNSHQEIIEIPLVPLFGLKYVIKMDKSVNFVPYKSQDGVVFIKLVVSCQIKLNRNKSSHRPLELIMGIKIYTSGLPRVTLLILHCFNIPNMRPKATVLVRLSQYKSISFI